MWWSVLFGFLGGLMGANAVPHFVNGITRSAYPCVAGNSPAVNVVAGWCAIVLAVLFWSLAGGALESLVAGAFGALLMGLFHALGGAYWLNTKVGVPTREGSWT